MVSGTHSIYLQSAVFSTSCHLVYLKNVNSKMECGRELGANCLTVVDVDKSVPTVK